MTRTCVRCKKAKEEYLFCWRSERATYRNVCLICEQKRNREHYRNNREYFKQRDSTVTNKTLARSKSKAALRRGGMLRKPCEVCGDAKTEAHHDDYTKPLAVRFLCKRHHAEHHRVALTQVQSLIKDITKEG